MVLESFSRRPNVRIAFLKEGTEHGQETNMFVSKLLKDALSLDDLLLVDHSHRALRRRPGDSEPPHPLMVRLHYLCDVTTILRKAAAKKDIFFKDQRIRIFPDFTPKVAKHRAAFNKTRELLRDKPGVKYGMLFPAKLRVTLNGKEFMFTDARKAWGFTQLHFSEGKRRTYTDGPVDA